MAITVTDKANSMKTMVRISKIGFGIILILGLVILGADQLISFTSKSRTYSDLDSVPQNNVGLLLGTGKHLQSGRINLYYKYRIAAAAELYKAGKIQHILVSGDNSRKDYDEPSQIKLDLIKHGVHGSKIHLDYAGFRTFDSVIRCKEIFGQDSITVISQQFHNERAIFIADRKGITAIGYNAQDISLRAGYKVMIREKLARVKSLLDWIFNKQAKFLGEQIEIK